MNKQLLRNVKILSTGSYLPNKILFNKDLEKLVNTNSEWIEETLGIYERRIADKAEFTSDLAAKAALNAIETSGLSINDIDLIIVATATPDRSAPSTAAIVQDKIKAYNAVAFDISAVCSGFLFAMSVASQYIASGVYNNVLVIGADTFSRITDWQRRDAVFFGDGAGAVILQHCDSNAGVIDSNIYSDGSMYDILYTDGGVSTNGKSGRVQMKGQEVFRRAIEKMSESVKQLLEVNGMSLSDIELKDIGEKLWQTVSQFAPLIQL